MKATVIICIISLSLCLSKASGAQKVEGTEPSTVPKQVKADTNVADSKNIVTETASLAPAPTKTSNAIPAQPEKDKPAVATEKATATDGKKATDKPEDNKTDNKTETTPAKSNDKPAQSPVTPKVASNETATSDGKLNTTTSTTVTPKPDEDTSTEKPTLATRGFDGPSFIGGIILTLGLLAIGFMGFKYYKNQTERNYHTL